MNLSDLESSNLSNDLAKMLKKQFDITMPIDDLSPSKVVKLHESIQNKLDKFRNTSKL